MNRTYARHLKRPLDIALSGAALLAVSPLLAASAVAIKRDSRGPVFFTQARAGLNGEIFKVVKFRSMLAPEASVNMDGTEMSNSERVTRVGRVLRRFSLDELPQLINVLKGDMSLVGPRPALPYQVERYSIAQRGRLAVRPGITGLAQVSGRNSLTWDEKIVLDIEYCHAMSFLRDLRIVVKTVSAVISSEGLEFAQHDALSDHGDSSYLKHI